MKEKWKVTRVRECVSRRNKNTNLLREEQNLLIRLNRKLKGTKLIVFSI